MWLICCDVRIRTARSGGSGVCGRPGHDRRNRKQEPDGGQSRGETGHAGRSTGGAEEGGAVSRTGGHGTQGVQSPSSDHRVTEADYRTIDTTVPTARVQSLDVRTSTGDIESGAGGNRENYKDGGNGRRPMTRAG